MLPGAVALEFVQSVAGRITQVVKGLRPVHQPQLPERARLDFGRHMLAALAAPDVLGLSAGVGEGADHTPTLSKAESTLSDRW